MKILFYTHIALMRLNFYLLRLWQRDVCFVGKCCCRRLRVQTVDGSADNKIVFDQHVVLKNCSVRFEGSGHMLHFGTGVKLENVHFYFEKEQGSITIGDGTWLGEGCELSAFDHSAITIGRGSIFAKGCVLRTSDSHVIRNSEGSVINRPTDIHVGSHVWCGQQTFILKGARVPDGCIVGACSMVTASSKAEPHSVLVGTPAKQIKTDITWEL